MRKPVFFLKFLFLLCLVAGGVTPRLTPYSPYARTGGEKYSDFSDSVAAAACHVFNCVSGISFYVGL